MCVEFISGIIIVFKQFVSEKNLKFLPKTDIKNFGLCVKERERGKFSHLEKNPDLFVLKSTHTAKISVGNPLGLTILIFKFAVIDSPPKKI